MGVPGLGVALVGFALLGSALRKRRWPKTIGRVVGGRERVDSDGDRMFDLIVEFTDAKGVTRKFTSKLSSSAVSHGKEVPVRYNPDAPDTATNTYRIEWIIGALIAAIGTGLWATAWWSFL